MDDNSNMKDNTKEKDMNEKLEQILMALATGKAAAKILDLQAWTDEIDAALKVCHELQKEELRSLLDG